MIRSDGRAPRWLAAALVIAGLAAAIPVRADPVDDHVARGRQLYDQGEFRQARDELLAAYQLEPRPELLFALGQVELNLGRFAQAIDYYQRFIATSPAADQIALAQQAIGAARARLAERPAALPPPFPKPAAPPRPPPQPRWDDADTGLVALGGAIMVLGGGLVYYGHHRAGDHSGTLSQYDDRLSSATLDVWGGAGCLVAGAAVLGSGLVRWRLHLVDAELQPLAAPRAAGVTWVQRW
ncbi:MAG TPA: tetratricopeptide repeat protein [Kofleriaceae bacterium]|jgi:tetratricopeptide (TPR) repeat protein|nr:tetratricopeptide repeat protein [Kofleriaceae bacterium]